MLDVSEGVVSVKANIFFWSRDNRVVGAKVGVGLRGA